MSWNLGAGHKIKALFRAGAGFEQSFGDQLPPPLSSKGIPTYITIKMQTSSRKCIQHPLTHPSPKQLPTEHAKTLLRKKYCFPTFFSQLWTYSKDSHVLVFYLKKGRKEEMVLPNVTENIVGEIKPVHYVWTAARSKDFSKGSVRSISSLKYNFK